MEGNDRERESKFSKFTQKVIEKETETNEK